MKKTLLIVDPQIDFCDPSGSLYVPGAEGCMRNLADWIGKENPDEIFVTMDTHFPLHIGFQNSWTGKNGEKPCIYSTIKPKEEGWTTYVNQDPPGEVQVWPEHCIIGTTGHSLYPILSDSLRAWQVKNKRIWIPIYKGQNCSVEEYGAFSNPITQEMVKNDFKNCTLYVAGVAGDYCVKDCLGQLRSIGIPGCTIEELHTCIAWINPKTE